MNARDVMGLALGFGIGIACRVAGIPLPAPEALVGALLVLALTLGYVGADRLLQRAAARELAAGRDGARAGHPPTGGGSET